MKLWSAVTCGVSSLLSITFTLTELFTAIKSENVLVFNGGSFVNLVDFGSAIEDDKSTVEIATNASTLWVSRGGHSVTIVGKTLVIFGGQDAKRSLLNDLHVLDLETMTLG